jgi:hypothetical protein
VPSTQRTIDAADERVTEVRFRGAEIAQGLTSFVESFDLKLRRHQNLLERSPYLNVRNKWRLVTVRR